MLSYCYYGFPAVAAMRPYGIIHLAIVLFVYTLTFQPGTQFPPTHVQSETVSGQTNNTRKLAGKAGFHESTETYMAGHQGETDDTRLYVLQG